MKANYKMTVKQILKAVAGMDGVRRSEFTRREREAHAKHIGDALGVSEEVATAYHVACVDILRDVRGY